MNIGNSVNNGGNRCNGNDRLNNTERRELPPLCRLCGKELTAEENINREIRFDESKLAQVATILSSYGHNNVALVGGAGTGKTALVSALAAAISVGKYKTLTGRRIVEVDIDKLLNNVYSTAEKGTRMANLLVEAEREGIVLFIDEGHRLYGAGEANSLGNIMKPFLTRDRLQVIIATTIDEYNLFIAQDPAFRRRFETVIHKEPNAEETLEILSHVMVKRYPEITAGKNTLKTLVDLGRRYVLDRNNPDKSLALMDTVVAWAKNRRDSNGSGIMLTEELVYDVVSNRLGVPRDSLVADVAAGLDCIQEYLSSRFPGWETSCEKVAESLNRARTRKLRRNGPLASAILCGTDMRLMTDISKAAAKKLGCAGEGAIFEVDVNKADPVDQYTACVRRNPNAALIFTGISGRTDPAVISRLWEILSNGKLKNNANQTADYSNAYVFFLCEDEPHSGGQIGFIQERGSECRISDSAAYLIEALGGDRNNTVAAGPPDAASIPELYEKVFIPLLEKSAKRCGYESRIVLSETAKSEVKKIIGTQTAWTGMHDAVEEIILSIMADKSGWETGRVVIGYEREKFRIDEQYLQPIVENRE